MPEGIDIIMSLNSYTYNVSLVQVYLLFECCSVHALWFILGSLADDSYVVVVVAHFKHNNISAYNV